MPDQRKNIQKGQKAAPSLPAIENILPHSLSPAEKAAADEELKHLRMLRLREMSDQQRLYADLLRLKFQMEDYVAEGAYSEAFSFGSFLQQYLKILNKKHKEFAAEIDLHTTKLSRLLNGWEDPNVQVAYRLEKHSGGIIPAILWWKLLVKKLVHSIRADSETKRQEEARVTNELSFQF